MVKREIITLNSPSSSPALPPNNSIIFPTVIREGNPCGFMIKSGVMPRSENGKSLCGRITPHTPFWPAIGNEKG